MEENTIQKHNIFFFRSLLGILLSIVAFFIIWFLVNSLINYIIQYSSTSDFFISHILRKFISAGAAAYLCFYPCQKYIKDFNPTIVFIGVCVFLIIFFMYSINIAISKELYKTDLFYFIMELLYLPSFLIPNYIAYKKIKNDDYFD